MSDKKESKDVKDIKDKETKKRTSSKSSSSLAVEGLSSSKRRESRSDMGCSNLRSSLTLPGDKREKLAEKGRSASAVVDPDRKKRSKKEEGDKESKEKTLPRSKSSKEEKKDKKDKKSSKDKKDKKEKKETPTTDKSKETSDKSKDASMSEDGTKEVEKYKKLLEDKEKEVDQYKKLAEEKEKEAKEEKEKRTKDVEKVEAKLKEKEKELEKAQAAATVAPAASSDSSSSEALKAAESERDSLKEEKESLKKQLEKEKQERENDKKSIDQLQATVSELQRKEEDYQRQLKDLKGEEERLVNHIKELESKSPVPASPVVKQSTDAVVATPGLERSLKTIEKYELQVEQNREKIESLRSSVGSFQEKLEKEEEESRAKDATIESLKVTIEEGLKREEGLKKDIVDLNDKVNELNHELEKAQEKISKFETEVQQLKSDDEKLKKIQELEQDLAKLCPTEAKEEDLGEKLASDFEWWGQAIDKKFKALAIQAPSEQDGKEEELVLSLKKHFAHASANENAWELNMGPVQYAVPSPYVSAAIWSMFYEYLNVEGKVPAGLKYAIAGASASSKLQSCPHQVEKMGISAGINGFEEYDAAIERAKNVSSPVSGNDAILRWVYLLDSGKGNIAAAPFSSVEAPEVIGTSLLMVVACRVVTVIARVGQSSSLPWFMSKSLASWVGKTYFTPQAQGVVLDPKASFDLTRAPTQGLPAKYAWCASEVLSETLQRFREAMQYAGEKSLDEKILSFASDVLEDWSGKSSDAAKMVTEGMKKWKPTPDEKETFKAKFVLMVMFTPNEVPDKDWTRLVSLVSEKNAINIVTWSGYELMERVAESLVGVKFEK